MIDGPRVAPSILAADFARLGTQVQEVLDAGARVIHVDVMDGHFVPPISMGALVVDALAAQIKAAGALVDVHLMVDRPERHVEAFAKAGADNITIHAEATPHVHYTLQTIRELGCTAGLAVCPATGVEAMLEVLPDFDLALCMTVNPGWGGQAFIRSMLDKIARLRGLCNQPIEVDGGIDAGTAGPCRQRGAGVFVAGSAVFGAPDPGAAYREIAQRIGETPRPR